MQTGVSLHEAETRLAQLIEQVEASDEVLTARGGRPVARLIGIGAVRPRRVLGPLACKVPAPEAWNAPLPADLLDAFERRQRNPSRAADATAPRHP